MYKLFAKDCYGVWSLCVEIKHFDVCGHISLSENEVVHVRFPGSEQSFLNRLLRIDPNFEEVVFFGYVELTC